MAILPAIHGDLLPAGEAARQLGLSLQRVRALAMNGKLPARKLAGRWFIARSAVARRLRERRLAGRPYSPAKAWGLIALAEGERADWLTPSDRSRLRRRLREDGLEEIVPSLARRAHRLELRAHPSDLPRIEQEPDVVRGGVSAGRDHRLEIVAPGTLEAYVPTQRLGQLERRYRLRPSTDPNVVLHVIDAPWPFEPHQRVAPRLATVLDLLEADDERSLRAGLRALQAYQPAFR